MKVNQILETSEWGDNPDPYGAQDIKQKIAHYAHEEDLMLSSLTRLQKIEDGRLYLTTSGSDVLPKTLTAQLAVDKQAFVTFNLSTDNPDKKIKVWIKKTDPALVRKVRAIVDQHNELSNKKAEFRGRLAGFGQKSTI